MQVARGTINIDLDDASALAGMGRAEAEFKAAMKRMDGQRAEAHIGADIRELKRDLAAAKAELAAFDRAHRAELERQRKIEKDNNGIVAKNARDRIRALEEERRIIETKHRNIKKTTDEYGYQLDNLKKVNREQADLNKRALEHVKRVEKATGAVQRQEIAVRRLQRQYMEAGREFRRLSTKNTPLGKDARVKLELDTKDALAKMEAAELALHAMGSRPIKQEVRLDQKFMRRQLEEAKQFGARTIDRLSNLSDVAVRFGPFTASVKQLAIAMSVLGPMIVDTVGGLTAFAGVLTTGIVGTAVTGGAALMGLGMAALGVGAALKPVIADFKVANTASQAWSKASLKYGANSKQAQKAQAQFNSTIKNMDPVSRQAFQSMGKLRNTFDAATQSVARKNFGGVLNEAMKTANKLLPSFTKNTNDTMNTLGTGLKGMLKGMGGKEGQGIFGGIFGNFNKMLPSIMSGLGQFGAAIGRIGLSASRNLPAVGRSFDTIMQKFAGSTANSGKLNASIDRLFHHSQDVFRLFGASGKLIGTVLNGGANAGDKLTNGLTKTLNRWNDFLKTPKGQNQMDGFFKRSTEGLKQIGRALAPLSAAFVQFSTSLSPAFAKLVEGFAGVMNLLHEFAGTIGAGGLLTTLPALFGGLFAIGKIGSFVAMLARAVSLLKEMAVAGKAAMAIGGLGAGLDAAFAAASGAGGLTSVFGSRRAREAKEATIAQKELAAVMKDGALATKVMTVAAAADGAVMAKQAGIFTKVGTAVSALRLGTLAGAAATAGYAAAVVAGTYVTYRGQQAAKGYGQEIAAVAGAHGDFGKAVAAGTDQVVRSNPILTMWAGMLDIVGVHVGSVTPKVKAMGGGFAAWAAEQQRVNQKVAEFKQAPAIFNQATNALTGLSLQQQQSTLTLAQAKQQLAGTTKGTLEYKQALLNVRTAAAQSLLADQQWTSAKQQLLSSINKEIAANKMASAADPTGAVRAANAARLNQLYNQRATVISNISRAEVGLNAITGKAAQQFGSLVRATQGMAGGQKLTQTIALKYQKPTDAGGVAAAAKAAIGRGVSIKTVLKIIADSSNANQAINRLRGLRLPPKYLRIFGNASHAYNTWAEINSLPPLTKNLNVRGNNSDAKRKHSVVNALKNVGKTLNIRGMTASAISGWNTVNALPNIHKVMSISGNISLAMGGYAAAKGRLEAAYNRIRSEAIARLNAKRAADAERRAQNKQSGQRQRGPGLSTDARGGYAMAADGADKSMLQRTQERAQIRAQHKQPQTTRGAIYRTPTLLVGEENRGEYVIATNPAYRDRNIGILRTAARQFGYMLEPAAVGSWRRKKNKFRTRGRYASALVRGADGSDFAAAKGRAPSPQQKFNRNRRKRGIVVPHLSDYIGPVETTDLESWVSRADAEITSATDKASKYRDKHKNKKGKLDEKESATYAGLRRRIAKAKKDKKDAQQVLAKAKVYKGRFDKVESAINVYGTAMEQASISPTGDVVDFLDPVRHKTYQAAKFWWLKEQRQKQLKERTSRLREVANDMQKDPRARNSLMYRKVLEALGTARTEEAENKTKKWEGPDAPAEKTLSDVISEQKLKGREDLLLYAEQQAASTETKADDKQAASDLAGFYAQFNDPAKFGVPIATEALSKYNQYIAQSKDETSASDSPDAQAQLDQANRKLTVARTSQRIAEAFATVAGRGGDMGFGGYSGRNAAGASPNGPYGGGGPTFIINTLHPGDPGTLSAIGDAATAGMGYQGYVTSPRLNTGL